MSPFYPIFLLNFFWGWGLCPERNIISQGNNIIPACDVAHIRVENIKRATYLCEYDVLFFY